MSGCSPTWAAASLDDEKFKTYVLPVRLTAKATGEPVRIYFDGCLTPVGQSTQYPGIFGVDWSLRQ